MIFIDGKIRQNLPQQYIYKISKEFLETLGINRFLIRYRTLSCSEEHYSPRTRIILARYLLAVPSVINKRIDRSTGQTWTRRYTLMSQPSFHWCFHVERDDAEERALFHAFLSIMQLPGNSMERQRYAHESSALSWKIISVNILMKIMGNFLDFLNT